METSHDERSTVLNQLDVRPECHTVIECDTQVFDLPSPWNRTTEESNRGKAVGGLTPVVYPGEQDRRAFVRIDFHPPKLEPFAQSADGALEPFDYHIGRYRSRVYRRVISEERIMHARYLRYVVGEQRE